MSPPEAFAMIFVFGGGFYVLRPIAAAVAKRISGDVGPRRDDELSEQVLTELRELREDVTALHERVDFTERLLARQREAERLAPPGRG